MWPFKPKQLKLCKDCRFVEIMISSDGKDFSKCRSPEAKLELNRGAKTSLVTGEPLPSVVAFASILRDNSFLCGEEARFFSPQEKSVDSPSP